VRIGALACRFGPEDDVRNVMRVYLSAIAALLAFSTASARDQVSDRARALHPDALVFDAHVHVVNRQFYHGGDMGQRVEDGQFDLARARDGGLDAPARYETKQVLRLIDSAHDQLARNVDRIELAFSASDVERISRSGRIAAFMDLEGGSTSTAISRFSAASIASACGHFNCRLTTGLTISRTPAARQPGGAASTIAAATSSAKAIALAW